MTTLAAIQERTDRAWALLLAVPDMDEIGTSTGIAQAAGVTRRTVSTMKLRLRKLRAEGQAITGTWADDMRDGPRPVPAPRVTCPASNSWQLRLPHAPRLTAEEKAARKAALRVEREEARKAQAAARHAEAVAIQAEAVARQQAEAAAMRQLAMEAKAERDAVPPELRPRQSIAVPRVMPKRPASTATVPPTGDRASLLAEMAERLGALTKAAP